MQLSVEGYKSISSRQELTLDGLTILSGANSSGKSSFMQPFLVLKQTIENHYDSGYLVLYGENAKLTDSSQIVSKVPGCEKKYFSVSMTDGNHYCSVSYKYKKGGGLQVDSSTMKNEKTPGGLVLRVGMRSQEIESMVPSKDFEFIKEFYKGKKQLPRWKAVRGKCFIGAELSFDGKDLFPLKGGIDPTYPIRRFITSLIHVPGLRGNPERSYKIAASEDVYPGSFERYVASIISDWAKAKKHQGKYELLKSQLAELGLASNIRTSKVDDTSVEIQVSRSKYSNSSDCVNIADVGFGVSQTIPVLVALIGAKKGQPVYIEQPELHLHPKAQFKLASMIALAVNRGVRVIIETHSSILIRGIQIAVVKKELDFRKVSLNWFSQDQESGETKVDKACLDEMGAFGDWPEDFDETSLSVEKMYLDAVEESLCE